MLTTTTASSNPAVIRAPGVIERNSRSVERVTYSKNPSVDLWEERVSEERGARRQCISLLARSLLAAKSLCL